jgi:hypothetical protein
MAKHWLRIDLERRNIPGIEIGLLFAALVCAGFAPWRADQSSSVRQLSDSQKTRLVRTLRPVAPALANVQLWSDDHLENVRYRLELTRIFQIAGVRTDAANLLGQNGTEPTRAVSAREQGLVIVVHDKDPAAPEGDRPSARLEERRIGSVIRAGRQTGRPSAGVHSRSSQAGPPRRPGLGRSCGLAGERAPMRDATRR